MARDLQRPGQLGDASRGRARLCAVRCRPRQYCRLAWRRVTEGVPRTPQQQAVLVLSSNDAVRIQLLAAGPAWLTL